MAHVLLALAVINISVLFAVPATAQESMFQRVLREWQAHYEPLVAAGALRDGNEPALLHHGNETPHAIVLVHGLTDSPFFMKALGERFHALGFTVLLPLLPGHGLKAPARRMNTVTLGEWQDEVEFAVRSAKQLGRRVSIGGLSTGGALSTWKALTAPGDITGGLFLFSAALDVGDFDQFVMSSDAALKILSIVDEKKRLGLARGTLAVLRGEQSAERDPTLGIGDNPYRYSEMFYNGAAQLALLIERIRDRYSKREDKYRDLKPPVFAAHSEVDQRAMIGEVELLVNQHSPQSEARFYRIPANARVAHASVVLSADITATQRGQAVVLEQRNRLFDDMTRDIGHFVTGQLGGR